MSDREQLRERLAGVVRRHDGHIRLHAEHVEGADAILAEIEAAGYVLMERDRADRLIEEGRNMQAAYADGGWGESELRPGDLDPLEGGE